MLLTCTVATADSLLDAPMTDSSSQSLDQARYNLCKYLEGRVAEVSLDVFKNSVLPPLTPGALNKLDDTVAHLVSNDRWNDFLEDPAHSTDREDVVFASLPELIDNIANAVAPVLGRKENSVTWKAEVCPSLAKNLHVNGNLHGTYLANIAPTTETPPTADDLSQSTHNHVWLYELKKAYDTFSVQGNRGNIIRAASHLLNDRRRRFTFALTVDNCTARLWFFSCFLVMASEEFDWIEGRTHFIHFIAALAFATETQLGFDPSIERVTENDTIKYNIHYCGRWYRILEDLSDFKASWILGPATRVWKVQELKDKSVDSTLVGKVRVMKDAWTDENALSEKEILDDIISKINVVNPLTTVHPALAADHFIEIMSDVRVAVTNPSGEQEGDCTSTIFQGVLPSRGSNGLSVSQFLETTESGIFAVGYFQRLYPEASRTRLEKKNPQFKGCTARQHRRILYAECGKPLNKILSDHKRLFASLGGITKALEILYSAGYIHHDLSLGNIISFDDGKCKLSDFEYAKPYKFQPGSEVTPAIEDTDKELRVGTLAFMAIEVQRGSYVSLVSTPNLSLFSLSAEERVTQMRQYHKRIHEELDRDPIIPFRHNYLHDVESLWWIAMWALFTTRPRSCPHIQWSKRMESIFPHSPDVVDGRELFFFSKNNRDYTQSLPDAFQGSISILEGIRVTLAVFYQHFQQFALGKTTEELEYGLLYSTVIGDFNAAANSAVGDLEMISEENNWGEEEPESHGMKRQLDDGSDDGHGVDCMRSKKVKLDT